MTYLILLCQRSIIFLIIYFLDYWYPFIPFKFMEISFKIKNLLSSIYISVKMGFGVWQYGWGVISTPMSGEKETQGGSKQEGARWETWWCMYEIPPDTLH